MSARDEYTTWDGAYVLGALSPAERREYEEHLRECEGCAASLAELSGLPGLLGRVGQEDAFASLDAREAVDEPGAGSQSADQTRATRDGAHADALPVLLAEARRRRRRTRWWGAAGLVAAAALIAVVAVLLPAAFQPGPADHVAGVTMSQVEPSPLSATVRLAAESWGTRIDMRCSYAEAAGADDDHAWSYVLVVTDRSGRQTPVSTWTASAGTTVEPVAPVSVPRDRIRSLEVRSTDGTVLLRSSFG
ncbi:MAG TPA: zf-HC2 domain-containing protein [Leifsonia sp.]